MSDRLVETILLSNHLRLEIWDLSRPLGGDRWLVRLETRIDVLLQPSHLDSLPDKEKSVSVLERVYGRKIPYRYVQEKHFVDHGRKDEVFKDFLEFVKKNQIPYLSHPDFSKRFILSRLRQLKAKNPQLFSSD